MITSLDVIDIQGQNIKFSEMSRHIFKVLFTRAVFSAYDWVRQVWCEKLELFLFFAAMAAMPQPQAENAAHLIEP